MATRAERHIRRESATTRRWHGWDPTVFPSSSIVLPELSADFRLDVMIPSRHDHFQNTSRVNPESIQNSSRRLLETYIHNIAPFYRCSCWNLCWLQSPASMYCMCTLYSISTYSTTWQQWGQSVLQTINQREENELKWNEMKSNWRRLNTYLLFFIKHRSVHLLPFYYSLVLVLVLRVMDSLHRYIMKLTNID